MTSDQKDQMFAWVQQAQRPMRPVEDRTGPLPTPRPWWEACDEPEKARAFVAEHLPHLLGAQP